LAQTINDFVVNGGTLLCLHQQLEAWTDKWLSEPIQIKGINSYVRGACEGNPLTWGVRQALLNFNNRDDRNSPFPNHFVLPAESKWKSLITSRLPKYPGRKERPEFTILAGTLCAELSHGKGKYILSQMPYGENTDQWITEVTAQIITNLGIKRTDKVSSGKLGSSTKVKPAKPEDWQNYFSVYLGEAANMTFKDKTPDDKKGGWTDQGENDMRHLPVGDIMFKGKPFQVIDPQDTVHVELQKSCIVLRDGTHKTWLPKERLNIKVEHKAKELMFLQCLAWASVKEEGQQVGTYEINYEDGTKVDIPLQLNKNIADWWHARDLPEAEVAWQGKNDAYPDVPIGIYLFTWKNPHPDKKIASLSMKSNGACQSAQSNAKQFSDFC